MTGWAAGRIALLHFTAPPAVGGVEALLTAQARVLRESGLSVTVIAGGGEPSADYELIVIPELHPANIPLHRHPHGSPPDADDPGVQAILRRLLPVLEEHDQVWVHNALTVYLNPCLTAALRIAIADLSNIRWVLFCHDLSAVSRYWATAPDSWSRPPTAGVENIRYVVLTDARRDELIHLWSLDVDSIRVIPPPLDALEWLGIGANARAVAERTNLFGRDITLFVPARLLPHKRLELAIRSLAALREAEVDALALVTGAPSPHEPDVSSTLARELRALARHEGLEDHFCLVGEALGRVPDRRTVRDLMSLCDLVYLPSAEEGYGMPIGEAAALRVPVLCSGIPAFRAAGGGYPTYVYLGAHPGSIAERMRSIASTPSNRRRHEVMRSMGQFRDALLDLALEDVAPPGATPSRLSVADA